MLSCLEVVRLLQGNELSFKHACDSCGEKVKSVLKFVIIMSNFLTCKSLFALPPKHISQRESLNHSARPRRLSESTFRRPGPNGSTEH